MLIALLHAQRFSHYALARLSLCLSLGVCLGLRFRFEFRLRFLFLGFGFRFSFSSTLLLLWFCANSKLISAFVCECGLSFLYLAN